MKTVFQNARKSPILKIYKHLAFRVVGTVPKTTVSSKLVRTLHSI